MNLSDFDIRKDMLIKYLGSDEIVYIPDGVISIEELAFKNCNTVKEVYFPESVCYIEEGAFADCHNLKKYILMRDFLKLVIMHFSVLV